MESRKVENLKKEYEEIPVPQEARMRILAGINKAKKENRKKGEIIMLKKAGTTAAAAMLAITALTNVNPTIANAMEQIPVVGTIAKVVTFRTFENKTNNFEAKVEIPQIEAEGNKELAVNKSIEEYADALIKQYEADLKASEGEGNYSLTSSYRVVYDGEKYLSLEIKTDLIMASGTEFVKIFTIDKATGAEVSLKEMLGNSQEKLDEVSKNIIEQMKAQMAADESIVYFVDSEVPEWNFKGLTGDESYYLNGEGQMVISFEEYQVAPGYMGAVEFTIPADITGKLN